MDSVSTSIADPQDDREPQRHLGYLIRRAQQLHVATWARVVSQETSSVQYSILAVVHRLGEASQRELCDEVDLDRSTIADLVARMERRGLVDRHRSPADARRNVVTLTEIGESELNRLRPLVEEVQRELVVGLTDAAAAQLRELLGLMLGDVRGESDAAAPTTYATDLSRMGALRGHP
nr:MarR family winged helix-turn-helix transcriptional regulator [Microbacterium immunditiarum]